MVILLALFVLVEGVAFLYDILAEYLVFDWLFVYWLDCRPIWRNIWYRALMKFGELSGRCGK